MDVSSAILAAIPCYFTAEFLDLLLYCAFTYFMRFRISFALSFLGILPAVLFTLVIGFAMFLLDEEFAIGGFELTWFRFPPVSLSMAAFCFYLYAGEYSRFFIYALEDLFELISFSLLRCLTGLFLEYWLLFSTWEDTTGRTGGLYYVFLGIEGLLIFGVVFRS